MSTGSTATEPPERPLDGRVALVTGAARGQGRSHALHLARQGASVIAIDMCAKPDTTTYDGATPEDLAATADAVRAEGGEVFEAVADVRHLDGLTAVVAEAVNKLGGLHIVVANAGIAGGCPIDRLDARTWQEMIDIDLTGVFHTVKAALPHLGAGASVVLISSANGGLKAPAHLAHYAAAKHGVVGLMRSLAVELGPRLIRVNSVHPTAVDTDMIHNDSTYRLFRPDLDQPGRADVIPVFRTFHSLPVPWIEPADVSAAVCFLASERARAVTGVALPVDAGLSAR